LRRGPQFSGLLGEAWLCVGSHPLRTFLAMLGIVIGVGAVVLMMAIGGGSRRAVEDAVNSLGSNLLMVVPGGPVTRVAVQAHPVHFEIGDATDIGQLPLVRAAAPVYLSRSFPGAAGRFTGDVQVTATTPDFFLIREWGFSKGGPFTVEDVRNGARVAVVGETVVEKVFSGESPLGQTLTIKG
jgi:putative ABC transport system permease protein